MEREREERRNSFMYTDVWDEHTRSEFLDATYEILDDCFWLWFLSWNHILFCKWSNSTHWGDKMEKTPLSLKCWHKYEKCCSCLMTSWSIVFNTLCVCVCVCVCVLSHVRLLVTPWTVAHQALLSIGFPRQEYWSGLPFPTLWLPTVIYGKTRLWPWHAV